ncbi:hypothetical protein QAD02_007447 [Eretmocerus hayati]|uniref:Uncharacterized protein n=1 Tax=Eretmocerus hayati TaxID=131215 RepID=A0ACC2N3M4_9HYME|nr:hypothetical protein QAD02_007447 [Eretmocerus hayati]
MAQVGAKKHYNTLRTIYRRLDGRTLVNNGKKGKITYFICQDNKKNGCRGSATLLDGQDELWPNKEHSSWCEPDGKDELYELKEYMHQANQENYWKMGPLFDEAAKKFPVGATLTSEHREYSTFVRSRLQNFPKCPNDMETLAQQLKAGEYDKILKYNGKYEVSADILVDGSKVKGKDTHIAFCEKNMIKKHFSGAKKMMADATYFVRMKLTNSYQLFTILIVYKNKVVCIYYCCMSSKTTAAYKCAFKHLKSICPFSELELFIGDFEPALRNGFAMIFPNVRIVGCNEHFDRVGVSFYRNIQGFVHTLWDRSYITVRSKVAILRKCLPYRKKADNTREFDDAVRNLLAIAYLPPEWAEDEFDRQLAEMDGDFKEFFAPVTDYFEDYWLKVVTPLGFTVYGLRTRTNNGNECNNNVLKTDLGKQPPAAIFMAWRMLKDPEANYPVSEFIEAIARLKKSRGLKISTVAEDLLDSVEERLTETPSNLMHPRSSQTSNNQREKAPKIDSASDSEGSTETSDEERNSDDSVDSINADTDLIQNTNQGTKRGAQLVSTKVARAKTRTQARQSARATSTAKEKNREVPPSDESEEDHARISHQAPSKRGNKRKHVGTAALSDESVRPQMQAKQRHGNGVKTVHTGKDTSQHDEYVSELSNGEDPPLIDTPFLVPTSPSHEESRITEPLATFSCDHENEEEREAGPAKKPRKRLVPLITRIEDVNLNFVTLLKQGVEVQRPPKEAEPNKMTDENKLSAFISPKDIDEHEEADDLDSMMSTINDEAKCADDANHMEIDSIVATGPTKKKRENRKQRLRRKKRGWTLVHAFESLETIVACLLLIRFPTSLQNWVRTSYLQYAEESKSRRLFEVMLNSIIDILSML